MVFDFALISLEAKVVVPIGTENEAPFEILKQVLFCSSKTHPLLYQLKLLKTAFTSLVPIVYTQICRETTDSSFDLPLASKFNYKFA
jgi:hypothetical protein